ncbi:Uncharacterized protein FWK35_00007753 [Aphis craccivora]|uniref:Uncharacterized protein n=1 Tax=Aphis craccivora TaxID=307492 RepID=A0A6G0Y8X0_APHCR|nr:Uncharacterized protein FWK35_00007753 [Aphis craccivora]
MSRFWELIEVFKGSNSANEGTTASKIYTELLMLTIFFKTSCKRIAQFKKFQIFCDVNPHRILKYDGCLS